MKILMLNPPFLPNFSRAQRSPAVTKSGTLYYPIWLSYATGVLEQAGHVVQLVDAPAAGLSEETCLQRAREFQPRLLVLDTSTGSIHSDVEVGKRFKQALPGSFLVLVGTHVSALAGEVLTAHPEVDAVAKGEYDYTLRDLAATLEQGGDPAAVAGLLLNRAGTRLATPERGYIEDLDALPFVSATYRKFLDVTKYFNPNAFFPMVQIISGRGCASRCIFCVIPQTLQGRSYRKRSVKSVVDELEYVQKNMPEIKGIFFEDDTLTSDRERCRELAVEVEKRGITLKMSANARADVDYETLVALKRANFVTLCVGFESGNQELLNNIKKGNRLETMRQFVADAKRAGILVHGCFMAGLPGETRETMRKTLEFAKEINPDTVQFYPIMVYPGTEAFEWYHDHQSFTTTDFSKWLTPDGLHNTIIKFPNLSPEEIVAWCDQARREFYLRPGYILAKVWQVLTNPRELGRKLKSARTFVYYLIRGSFSRRNDNRSC